MKYEVDAEILAKTARCDKGFSCLKHERPDLCRVKACIAGEIYFIQCSETLECPYKVQFGKEFMCTCPTRKALFHRYGV